jgi:predicted O-methyltransferase YrrM
VNSKKIIVTALDYILSPFTYLAAIWLRFIRKNNVGFWGTVSPLGKKIFKSVGVFPIIDHYYEPLFDGSKLTSLRENRHLPGIDLNVIGQTAFLNRFNYGDELLEISKLPANRLNYSFTTGPFRAGDSCVLYSMVRYNKPRRIVEIGCGSSTLIIQHAITNNKKEDMSYACEHICIEPYENEWIAKLDVVVKRQKVEDVDLAIFKALGENDILFIDSSHMIRPQGDVLFEYLQILPSLKKGVIIHIHDIFTPKDYLDEWILTGVNFWNEQYLLEAFLSCNNQFEIVCAVNFLKHNYYETLARISPMLTMEDHEPGSFWIRKTQ